MKFVDAALAALLLAGVTPHVVAADANNIFGVVLPESLEDMDALAYEDSNAGLSFHKWYGSYFFQGMQEYDDPGLGYSLTYATPSRSFISVYVYTLGRPNIPDGADSDVVAAELAQSAQAVGLSGQYGAVVEEEAEPLSPHFAQVFHRTSARTDNGEPLVSYTLLRGQNGHFIKVRLTGSDRELRTRGTGLLEYLVADLGLEEDPRLRNAD